MHFQVLRHTPRENGAVSRKRRNYKVTFFLMEDSGGSDENINVTPLVTKFRHNPLNITSVHGELYAPL